MRFQGEWFRASGLLVAVIGFGITRLVVAEAIDIGASIPYLISGLLPLVLGLGLTAYGVGLTVGTYPESHVRIVAKWCILGTLAMIAVLAISSVELLLSGGARSLVRTSPMLTSNTLLAGAIGGVAIGRRTARIRSHRERTKRQANRALLLDRLLRHEVLNAITSIRLWAPSVGDSSSSSDAVHRITDATDRIDRTIDDVADLIEEDSVTDRVDLARLVATEIERLQSANLAVELAYDGPPSGVHVAADFRLARVVEALVKFANENTATSRISISTAETEFESRLSVTYTGGELSENSRRLLTSGEFPEFDDPSTGFTLPIVRILVREYDGDIELVEDSNTDETRIDIRFPKFDGRRLDRHISVSTPRLVWAAVTGLVAGAVMGVYLMATSDSLPVIGALYGVPDPIVGWTTHLFHSVVFAMIYAAAGTHSRLERYVSTLRMGVFSGATWGLVLWLLAAGVIMPFWLVSIGIPAQVPNLPIVGLVSHMVWGATVGLVYPVVDRVEGIAQSLHLDQIPQGL